MGSTASNQPRGRDGVDAAGAGLGAAAPLEEGVAS